MKARANKWIAIVAFIMISAFLVLSCKPEPAIQDLENQQMSYEVQFRNINFLKPVKLVDKYKLTGEDRKREYKEYWAEELYTYYLPVDYQCAGTFKENDKPDNAYRMYGMIIYDIIMDKKSSSSVVVSSKSELKEFNAELFSYIVPVQETN